jgi:hypothetical protein
LFLVHLPTSRIGFDHWIFFEHDPRPEGCTMPVIEHADLEDRSEGARKPGSPLTASYPILGRSTKSPAVFKLFSREASIPLEFEVLEGFAFAFRDWKAFMESPIAKDEKWRPIQ